MHKLSIVGIFLILFIGVVFATTSITGFESYIRDGKVYAKISCDNYQSGTTPMTGIITILDDKNPQNTIITKPNINCLLLGTEILIAPIPTTPPQWESGRYTTRLILNPVLPATCKVCTREAFFYYTKESNQNIPDNNLLLGLAVFGLILFLATRKEANN